LKLGKRELDALVCPPGRRDVLVFDDELTGFAVRVTAAGTRTFLFQYRQGKTVRRLRIGEYGDITPAQARRLAEEARGAVAGGGDPAADRRARMVATVQAERETRRKQEADSLTVGVLLDRWEKLGLNGRGELHRAEAPRAVRTCFHGLLDKPAHSLDAGAVQRAVDRIARTRPVMARRGRDYARAMFNWAIRRRLLTANPFAAAQIEGREVSRDRVLSDDELGEAWRGARAVGPPFDAFFELLILTLQRRAEVAGMLWDELSDDLSTWTVPAARAKNGKAHIVHLAEPARVVLRNIPRRYSSGYVFTTTGQSPISGFQNAKERLHAKIVEERIRLAQEALEQDGAPPIENATGGSAPRQRSAEKGLSPVAAINWRLHDFRRTGVTVMARLGIAPHVADRLLNHVQGTIRGVAAVYQRHEFLAERQAAIEAWAAHVLAVAQGRAAGSNVVTLAAKRSEGAR
jgi:integrase